MNETPKHEILSGKQRNCILFVLSALSIVYELLIAKSIVELTDNTTMWKSITVGVYIAGLGWGTIRGLKKAAQNKNETSRLRKLVENEYRLVLLGATAVPLIFCLHILYRIYAYPLTIDSVPSAIRPLDIFCIFSQIVTLSLGVLTGQELPLLEKPESTDSKNRSEKSAPALKLSVWLATMNIGSLIGTFVFAAMLKSEVHLIQIGVFIALSNAALCLFVWIKISKKINYSFLVASFSALLLLAGVFSGAQFVNQVHAKNFYFNMPAWLIHPDESITITGPAKGLSLFSFLQKQPQIAQVRTPYQMIEWVKSNEDMDADRLYLNRHFQVSSVGEKDYHQALTLAPMIQFSKIPKSALILGGGDGLLVRDLLKLRKFGLKKLKIVELDQEMIEFAQTHPGLVALNQNALNSPFVEIVNSDAFVYARRNQEKWDAIFIDFPYPYSPDIFKVYTKEFYSTVKKKLNPNGFIALDFPFQKNKYDISEDLKTIICSTLKAAGFSKVQAFESREESFVSATIDPHFEETQSSLGSKSTSEDFEDFRKYTLSEELFFRNRSCRFDSAKQNRLFRPTLFSLRDPSF